ncbi:hypothetical protein QF030_000002 [Streptomyces rishiriensis]|uniref:Uncharacterized protein n=1 Tax=Streptomyces rishiriensis TaxID=68264 RepID=A0ABU0NFF0_STRRH|nr:hypothetical protein [Streptomyces rishiriensis]
MLSPVGAFVLGVLPRIGTSCLRTGSRRWLLRGWPARAPGKSQASPPRCRWWCARGAARALALPGGDRIRHQPRRPPAPQLRPLRSDLHPVRGGEPHPAASCLRQGDPVDQALGAEFGQPPSGLLDPHLRGDDLVHLLGGGHPVLHQHRQLQPVPGTGIHIRSRHRRQLPYAHGAVPPCCGTAVSPSASAGPDHTTDRQGRPRSRCGNTISDRRYPRRQPHPRGDASDGITAGHQYSRRSIADVPADAWSADSRGPRKSGPIHFVV